MVTIDVKLTDLKKYKNNPRFNEQAVDVLARSIKDFGFLVPIVIDKNNEIVCGHTRALAAAKLGLETVPCVVADKLNDEQIRLFRIADNKVHDKSFWNNGLLREELELLDSLGVDLNSTGMLESEIKSLMGYVKDVGREIDLSEFDDENYQHFCKFCGFRW